MEFSSLYRHGFARIAACTLPVALADPATNAERIYIFNYRKNSGISGATPLARGDVIVVPERGLFE